MDLRSKRRDKSLNIQIFLLCCYLLLFFVSSIIKGNLFFIEMLMTSNKYSDHDHLDRYGEDAYVRECQTMKQGIEEISTMAKEKWQKLSQKTRSLIA